MALLPVDEALRRVLDAVTEPVEAESVALAGCHGRVLAQDVAARRTQPPFPASAMDGYAVRSRDVAGAPVALDVIGESVAGRRYAGAVGPGQAVRIFTGAPVPEGADAIAIQENAEALEGHRVRIREPAAPGRFVRPAGLDFREGDILLRGGLVLDARAIALAAAMNHATLPVRRRPRVAIIATGDELVPPGADPGPDQIVASNICAVASVIAKAGGEALDCGIARDTREDVARVASLARDASPDIMLTMGGASVGEHDLVQEVLTGLGLELGFWRIAMRPGKPLIHGRFGDERQGRMLYLGLPGNPVASMICTALFVVPAIRALLGLRDAAAFPPTGTAILAHDLAANDLRRDYLRATLEHRPGELPLVTPFEKQDSSMLGLLARADALVIRAPHAAPARAGEIVEIIRLTDIF